MFKAVPGAGWMVGTIVQAGLAGASTYAVGSLFRAHFAREGTFESLDAEASRPIYEELLERGRGFIEGLRASPERTVEDVAELLERIERLRERNVIGEQEFQALKRRVLVA